jgi:hypothetical protein
MLNRKTAAGIVLAGLFIAGIGSAQTLEDNWNDFLHYTKIGRFDLAKGYAQAVLQGNPEPVELFKLTQENPQGYEFTVSVAENTNDAELAALAQKLVALIDFGRFVHRADPQMIVDEIRRLSTTARGKLTAIQRLNNAGEYAVPFMIDAMSDPARRDEIPNIIEALGQLGRPAVRPLTSGLQTTNAPVKVEIIRALGKIGYPQALAYLQYVVEKEQSPALRSLAAASIQQIDPGAANIPAAALFFQLAEKYYYHSESLAAAADANFANVWFWDSAGQKLTREQVYKKYFNELMAMQCCEWSLRADEQFGPAIGLWLAAFFKAEATGVPMPRYFGEKHADALVYATTAGPEYLHQALARAVKDNNADVALGAIEALATTAGEKSLLSAVGPVQPVLQALSFDDKAVRYSTAIAIANAGPRQNFAENRLVVTNLAEAILQSSEPNQENSGSPRANPPAVERWNAAFADSYALRAAAAMLKVAQSRNPVINLSGAQAALIKATRDNRNAIKVLAGQILAHLNSPDAQSAVAAMALDPDNSAEVRISAFDSLGTSAKMNTNLLPDAAIDQIYALISAGDTAPELRAAAAAAYGALNLPSRKVKDLILDQAKS